ncbi:MAG: GNAT family N-acetyltransferase [Propionibacteriaceae bacterium]|nr:GNAT family N-acetyltransferase [Propionibacteriaceae bacterium]
MADSHPIDHPPEAAAGLSVPPTVRRARTEEWRAARDLRLEMLADTPHSFGDVLADVVCWDDDRWITRHESDLLPDSEVFVAVDAAGRWVGQMAAREFHNYSPARAWLLGVYVTPAHRGATTATALLEAVQTWALDRGFAHLYLDVHEQAGAARKFYERQGFVATGVTAPYPLDVSTTELEMVKLLHPGSAH